MAGTPSTTTASQGQGTLPPGYGAAGDWFNSMIPMANQTPFPMYGGQIDPGLSPTLQQIIQRGQGLSSQGAPSIFQGVQGALSSFFNPQFGNPNVRIPMGYPDYFGMNPQQKLFGGNPLGSFGWSGPVYAGPGGGGGSGGPGGWGSPEGGGGVDMSGRQPLREPGPGETTYNSPGGGFTQNPPGQSLPFLPPGGGPPPWGGGFPPSGFGGGISSGPWGTSLVPRGPWPMPGSLDPSGRLPTTGGIRSPVQTLPFQPPGGATAPWWAPPSMPDQGAGGGGGLWPSGPITPSPSPGQNLPYQPPMPSGGGATPFGSGPPGSADAYWYSRIPH